MSKPSARLEARILNDETCSPMQSRPTSGEERHSRLTQIVICLTWVARRPSRQPPSLPVTSVLPGNLRPCVRIQRCRKFAHSGCYSARDTHHAEIVHFDLFLKRFKTHRQWISKAGDACVINQDVDGPHSRNDLDIPITRDIQSHRVYTR